MVIPDHFQRKCHEIRVGAPRGQLTEYEFCQSEARTYTRHISRFFFLQDGGRKHPCSIILHGATSGGALPPLGMNTIYPSDSDSESGFNGGADGGVCSSSGASSSSQLAATTKSDIGLSRIMPDARVRQQEEH